MSNPSARRCVYLAVIEQDNIYHRTAHVERSAARAALMSYVRANWNSEDDIPADPSEAISEFSDNSDTCLSVIDFDVDFYVGDTVAVVQVIDDHPYGTYGFEVFPDRDAAIKGVADYARVNWSNVVSSDYHTYHDMYGVQEVVPLAAPDTDSEAFDLYWRVAYRHGDVDVIPILDQDAARDVYSAPTIPDMDVILWHLAAAVHHVSSDSIDEALTVLDTVMEYVKPVSRINTLAHFDYPKYLEGVQVI